MPNKRDAGAPMTRPARSSAISRRSGRSLKAAAVLDGVRITEPDTTKVEAPTNLPPDIARQAQREMDRLRRLPAGSSEAGHVRSYLQWLWSVPWDRCVPEDVDLSEVEAILDRD